jgi:hypothetical protein
VKNLAFTNVTTAKKLDAPEAFAVMGRLCPFCFSKGGSRVGASAVVRFAYGLQKDISAVAAAVETSWSTGQVEGQINRLKTIKRKRLVNRLA